MKIKANEDVFILPEKGIHLLISDFYTNQILECLTTFFVQKKKTKCIVFDEDEAMIDFKAAGFIYIPAGESIDSWFDFKPKTLLNAEISEFISKNERLFESVQNIRDDMQELLTDRGIFEIYRILEKDLPFHTEMRSTNFEISKLLQMYSMDVQDLTRSQQFMILYNLLIFLNRDRFRIIYIDFEVTEDVYAWLKNKNDGNSLILVNNESIHNELKPVFDSAIVISNYDHVQTLEISLEQADLISYMFHPVVRRNLRFQTEKNLKIMKLFDDEKSTFFVKFTADSEPSSL